jgi:hypothetical protein
MSLLRSNNTLSIRRIDPDSILKQYRDGKYKELNPEKVDVFITESQPSKVKSAAHCYQCVTLHDQRLRCNWCRKEITTERFGIPIRYREEKDEDGKKLRVYTCVGNYHRLECAYTDFYYKKKSSDARSFGAIYADASSIFRLVSLDIYGTPEIKLLPPLDFLHHGSEEEYFGSKIKYVSPPNVVMNFAPLSHYTITE